VGRRAALRANGSPSESDADSDAAVGQNQCMTRAALLTLTSLFALACPTAPPSDDDDAVDDDDVTGDDDDSAAWPAVVAVHPEDGAQDHFAWDDLWVEFAEPTSTPTLELVTAGGAAVPGTGRWITATRWAFDPTDGLGFEAEHSATVAWGSRSYSWGFTTSNVGSEPVGAGAPGDTQAIQLASGTAASPVGGDTLLGQMALVMLQQVVDDGGVGFLHAMAERGSNPPAQDACSPALHLDATTPTLWEDPWFHAGPVDVVQRIPLPVLGPTEFLFRGFELSGVYAASTAGGPVDRIEAAAFSAVVDVRDSGSPCEALPLLFPELECVACPHEPTSVQCLLLEVTGMSGALVPDLGLDDLTAEDVAANLDCEE